MSKSTPSLLALLGLVAVAGYQNRGRISDMLADAGQPTSGQTSTGLRKTGAAMADGQTSFLSDIGRMFRASTSGGTLATGLGDLVAQLKASGGAAQADSWVSSDANMPMDVTELEAAIGTDTLDDLGQKLGLSRAELLLRLAPALPEVVNRLTPNGHLPTETEAQSLV